MTTELERESISCFNCAHYKIPSGAVLWEFGPPDKICTLSLMQEVVKANIEEIKPFITNSEGATEQRFRLIAKHCEEYEPTDEVAKL